MTKPISKQEKDHAEEILDRNLYLVRKIEYYQYSRWRRLKFWWKKKWAEKRLHCIGIIAGAVAGVGLIVGLLLWALLK